MSNRTWLIMFIIPAILTACADSYLKSQTMAQLDYVTRLQMEAKL